MNEENEQRVNVRMARRQQQKKETQRRLIKIGSAVAVCLVLIGAVTALYFMERIVRVQKARSQKQAKLPQKKLLPQRNQKIKKLQVRLKNRKQAH